MAEFRHQTLSQFYDSYTRFNFGYDWNTYCALHSVKDRERLKRELKFRFKHEVVPDFLEKGEKIETKNDSC